MINTLASVIVTKAKGQHLMKVCLKRNINFYNGVVNRIVSKEFQEKEWGKISGMLMETCNPLFCKYNEMSSVQEILFLEVLVDEIKVKSQFIFN